MGDITNEYFTIERKSEILIITYNIDQIFTFNIRDIKK
jgi:hypothetical protein